MDILHHTIYTPSYVMNTVICCTATMKMVGDCGGAQCHDQSNNQTACWFLFCWVQAYSFQSIQYLGSFKRREVVLMRNAIHTQHKPQQPLFQLSGMYVKLSAGRSLYQPHAAEGEKWPKNCVQLHQWREQNRYTSYTSQHYYYNINYRQFFSKTY